MWRQQKLFYTHLCFTPRKKNWWCTDSPAREIRLSPGSGSNPATPNFPHKEINKDFIKSFLSLNDCSHKCFNHQSLGAQLCEFVWVCVWPSCDVRLVSALHRWVYLAARRACNLPTFISHCLPSPVSFVLLIEPSVAGSSGCWLSSHAVVQDATETFLMLRGIFWPYRLPSFSLVFSIFLSRFLLKDCWMKVELEFVSAPNLKSGACWD